MRRTVRTLFLAVALALALPGVANAGGRLIETGHDADWDCTVVGTQCNFIKVAVNYVRNGAPDPTKKLLVLDKADCWLYELYQGSFANGQWTASQSPVWDLQNYNNCNNHNIIRFDTIL